MFHYDPHINWVAESYAYTTTHQGFWSLLTYPSDHKPPLPTAPKQREVLQDLQRHTPHSRFCTSVQHGVEANDVSPRGLVDGACSPKLNWGEGGGGIERRVYVVLLECVL